MRFTRMTEVQEDLFQQIRTIRATKGMEYATEEDTLADFKEVAAEVGSTPIQTWATYVKKHLRAVDTFVREGDVKSESIESRVLDVVTYHVLLLGLIEDLREERAEAPSARQCSATGPGGIHQCLMAEGHEGKHHDGVVEWGSEPAAPQCSAWNDPSLPSHLRARCELQLGHSGDHDYTVRAIG